MNLKNLFILAASLLTVSLIACNTDDEFPPVNNVEIDVSSYATPNAYKSGVPEHYTYDAKVVEDTIYIHMVQTLSKLNGKAHIVADIMDENLLGADKPLRVTAYPDRTCKFDTEGGIEDYSLVVNREKNQFEYLLKLKCHKNLSDKTRIKFYSYDPEQTLKYSSNDFIVACDEYICHTHIGKGWYVASRIGFKPESLFPLPEEAAVPLPDKWGFTASAEPEGVYIYAYQNHAYVQGTDKWLDSSHMEFSLFHHNIGYGSSTYNRETYIALWKSGDVYINFWNKVYGHELITTVMEDRTEYRFFMRFNNNIENPAVGGYAMLKARSYDPNDDRKPYSYDDIVEFRDNRFVHTTKGSSYYFSQKFRNIYNLFEEEWRDNKVNDFKNNGLEGKENLTLFIGDSFFDVGWWENFYTDYKGKAAHTSAIGGTTTWQWLNWAESLIKPFDANLKNIVIHLGYNDLNYTNEGLKAEEVEFYTERLIELLHNLYPDANIYYCGIGTSEWFATRPEPRAKVCDALAKAFCESRDYVTFVDMDAAYKKYMDETGGTLASFFKDNTHPKNENYKYLMEQIELAGCVIE